MGLDLLDAAQLGWAAGIIDGEGSIGVYCNNHRHYKLQITVANTDPRMVLKLQDILGGAVCTHKRQLSTRKNYFIWSASARQAHEILEILLPFFVAKKEQAMVALEFARLINPIRGQNKEIPEATLARRSALSEGLKKIKQIEFPEDCIYSDGSWPSSVVKKETL
jgi:hypothetical protein